MKHDWKKLEKRYYAPGSEPELVTLPAFKFFTVRGRGDPNGPDFPSYVEALYAASYGVKMSPKKGNAPEGYVDYAVYPLEGVWDLSDEAKARGGAFTKDELVFTLMIRQPEFVTEAFAREVLAAVRAKKKGPRFDELRFELIEEGPCVQMLHEGPYDDEPASFARMESFAAERGLRRACKTHREIYLSDARRTEPARLRTILRFRVG